MPIPSEVYWEYDKKVITPMINEVREVLKFIFDGELTLRLATKNRRKSMPKQCIGYWNYIIVDFREEIVGVVAISLYKSLDSSYLLGIWLQLHEIALEIEYKGKIQKVFQKQFSGE